MRLSIFIILPDPSGKTSYAGRPIYVHTMKLIKKSGAQGVSHSRRLSLVTMSGVLIVALALPGAFFLSGKTTASQQVSLSSQSYSDNGLSCSVPPGTPAFIAQLVPAITQSQKFLAVASGQGFVFEHWDNITERSVTVGTTTSQLPPVVELVFYTYGPNTACEMTGETGVTGVIYAQVPIVNGAFSMSGATVTLSHYVGQPG